MLRLVGQHLGGLANYPACRNYVARAALLQAGINAGEIADYGFVRVCDVHDPDGNRLSFVQLIS